LRRLRKARNILVTKRSNFAAGFYYKDKGPRLIHIKELSEYFSDDEAAVFTRTTDLKTMLAGRRSELAAIDAKIAVPDAVDSRSEDQVQSLITGVEIKRPPPLNAQRMEIQYAIRDLEEALDFMAGKELQANLNAGARLAEDIKPQVDTAAKELFDALALAHDRHFSYWTAKRHVINLGVGLNGLFDSAVDDVLGIPTDKGSPLAFVLREAVRQRQLRTLPKAFVV
jgi:hypothetical protein